ncbi:MAG: DUF5777 family beta-barrel protein [Ginsengibacter sp.]
MKKNRLPDIHFLKLFLGILLLTVFFTAEIHAQDTDSLINQLEKETLKNKTVYTTATFKTTRIVDGQSAENLPKNVLDVRISHRFGPVSSGVYNFFGLDNATMRLGFDYGITNNLMVGIGHSTYQKTYDAFFKIKLLSQSAGAVNIPVTLSFVPVIAINTLNQFDTVKTIFGDRVSQVYQLLIARKFSEEFALQIMPTFIHADKISFNHIRQNIFAIGIGGRHRISKRININAEYYYQLPDSKAPGSHNVLSFGIDIGTGGHVFQLHFTNSNGLTEKSFISETTGRWDKSDVLFGFNISRVFQLKKKHS